jgi:RNA polymerase sigma factor (sigma-70 family)
MIAAAEGDRSALEPLFQALWPVAVSYATRLLAGDLGLAEDCAQEGLVRLFGQLDRFDRTRDGLTWALTLVTWQCRTARQRRARQQTRAAGEAMTSLDAVGDGRALAEERQLVRLALAELEALPRADLDVITAALLDDQALRERVAPATFRKRLSRAHARLRDAWRARHGSI